MPVNLEKATLHSNYMLTGGDSVGVGLCLIYMSMMLGTLQFLLKYSADAESLVSKVGVLVLSPLCR